MRVSALLRVRIGLSLVAALLAGVAGPLGAQGSTANTSPTIEDPILAERYLTPPPLVEKLVTTQRDQNVLLTSPSPGHGNLFARTVSDGLPALALLGKPYHNLGGWQVDRVASRSRALTTRSNAGIEIRNAETGSVVSVSVPRGARVGPTAWSPDGGTLAYLALFEDATHIYLANPATGQSRALTRTPVLATNVTSIEWTADSRGIVTVLFPDRRGAEPAEPPLATQPLVRVNEQTKLRTRTYASLLASPYEQSLVRYYATGQLAVIDVQSRAVRTIGAPAMIKSVSVSPDGTQFRVTTLDEPFSYSLPVSSFGQTENVLDAKGELLVELSKRPLNEGESTDDDAPAARSGPAADTGRRNVQWHPTQPGLLYAQAVPARAGRGDSARSPADTASATSSNAARRGDRLMHWLPPYDSSSTTELYRTSNRITASRFSDDGTILFVTETGNGGTTDVAMLVSDLSHVYTLVAPSRAARDSAARAGGATAAARGRNSAPSLVTKPGRRGAPSVIVSSDGQSVLLQGSTPDTTGEQSARVWVDRVNIRTGARSRLYESSQEVTESIAAVLDDDGSRLLITRETASLPPQSFMVDVATGAARQLTNNIDLTPEVSSAIRRTVIARRADGFTFKVHVTLPANYQKGTRLPAMFWFYPREYNDQDAYDRATESSSAASRRFPSFGPRSMAFLTTQGYAVVEPDAPIFAANGLPSNDNYVADLRNGLAATIDALDTLEIIDRQRLAIGGHSYGAFSAVNAMVHTPYFKAGIAGDGNYNRTLTPNGFQSERRDLWQGRDTYLSMSPFFYADKLNGALLMYHSTDDQNVGTAPINSERLFHALQGLGKDVSLYMYPYEDHGPIARETVLDQWARWVAWLDKYVKGAGSATKGPVSMEDAS